MHDFVKTDIGYGSISPQRTESIVADRKISSDVKKISLIIPVYHEEKILNRILSKYTKDILDKYSVELIISDGGSTDNTCEIARQYTDKIAIHKDQRRQTISEGRNCGAVLAEGDIFVFINGDTYPQDVDYFFGFIRDWADHKTDYSDYSALACKVWVEEKEQLLKDRIFYTLHNHYVRLLNKIGVGMGRGECQIMKADIFKKIGGYNNSLAAGEDFDLYKRISKVGKIGFADELTVFESPRRFRKYGYIKVLWQWTVNSLAVMFKGRSSSQEWEAVR